MTDPLGDNTRAQLKAFAERLSTLEEEKARLAEEKKALSGDIADVFKEAQGCGLSPKALKRAVKEMGMEAADRQLSLQLEWETDAYREVLGIPTMAGLLAQSAAERIRASKAEGKPELEVVR